jgi:hypothetical protein
MEGEDRIVPVNISACGGRGWTNTSDLLVVSDDLKEPLKQLFFGDWNNVASPDVAVVAFWLKEVTVKKVTTITQIQW